MLVRTELSVVSAIEAIPGRSAVIRLTNSAARCWASAALPPFPKNNALPPPASAAAIARAAASTAAVWRSQKRRTASWWSCTARE